MLRLALFLFPGHHLGAWRLPEAIPEFDVGIEHYVRAAQLAEEAKLDAIFFEDQAAIPRANDILKGDTYGAAHPRAIHFDPMMLLPALAMTTKYLRPCLDIHGHVQRALQRGPPVCIDRLYLQRARRLEFGDLLQ